MHKPGGRDKYLQHVDSELTRLWRLGRNAIIGWCAAGDSIDVLFVPQFLLPSLLSNYEEILVGSSRMTRAELRSVSDICEIEPYNIKLAASLKGQKLSRKAIDRIVERYAITKIEVQAVLLFDIVGFSLYSTLEQVTALNSLSYSVNIACQRAREHGLNLSLANSPTGDGFYVWNLKGGLGADIDLFCLMMLILADNALGAEKATKSPVLQLRACFHIGSCYEYYQAVGESLGTNHFIVGDVTIESARMIGGALSGQILVGSFLHPVGDASKMEADGASLSTVQFIERVSERLRIFEHVTLSREKVTAIKCYLTGERRPDGLYNVSRYAITDKHGMRHEVFNAKVNVHRQHGKSVYLGRKSNDLTGFDAADGGMVEPFLPIPELGTQSQVEGAVAGRQDQAAGPCILVVDDNAVMRKIAATLLGNLGYRVLRAENGPAAVAILDEANIDLLFTDIIMPGGMDGVSLARYAVDRYPGIKVLYASGYAKEAVLRRDERNAEINWISKPYRKQDLERTVRGILESRHEVP